MEKMEGVEVIVQPQIVEEEMEEEVAMAEMGGKEAL
jgi:hypothetical protein